MEGKWSRMELFARIVVGRSRSVREWSALLWSWGGSRSLFVFLPPPPPSPPSIRLRSSDGSDVSLRCGSKLHMV